MDTPKSTAGGTSSDMPSYLQSKFSISDTPKARPQGKRIIESRIGVSQEAPSYFRTQHGAVSSATYQNPYISGKVDESNTPSLKNKQTFSIFSKLREDQKKDFFHIKEIKPQPIYNLLTHQKTDVGKMDLQINERPKFNDEYKKLQESTSTPFHRKSNYFSDFVERNDVMNVYGHLNMRERPTELKRVYNLLQQKNIVKDYSLDQNQLSMIKTVRENSQPSRLSRNNSTISGLTPRLAQKTNSDSFVNQSITLVAGKKSLFNPLNNANTLGDNFTSTALPLMSQDQNQLTKDEFDINKLKNITLQTSVTSRNDTQDYSLDRQNYNTSINQSKLQASLARQKLHYKVPRKIIQTKYDKMKEEESVQELKCIDEFEQHLRFIQGNSLGGQNQGSVFFKDSKRI